MASFSNNNSKTIAVCTGRYYGPMETEFVKSLYTTLKDYNFRIVVFGSSFDFYTPNPADEAEGQIFKLLNPSDFDAVVIYSATFYSKTIVRMIADKSLAAGVPTFAALQPVEGCITLRFDYSSIFETIVNHVLDFHNVKDTVMIAGFKDNSFSNERIECYKRALQSHNIPFNESDVLYGDFWEEPTAMRMNELFESGRKIPEAIICANDFMAMEVCRQLASRGYKVPDDVIVTGFDGVYVERFFFPRLTTAVQDLATLSLKIYEVLDNIENNRPIENEYVVNFKFRPSQSCGCRKHRGSELELTALTTEFAKEHKASRQLIYNYERLNSVVSKYSNVNSLNTFFDDMPGLLRESNISAFAAMFNTDYLDKDLEPTAQALSYNRESVTQHYTPTVFSGINVTDRTPCRLKTIRTSSLAPFAGKMLARNQVILLTPLYVSNETVGYFAAAMNPETFVADIYYSCTGVFNQIMGAYTTKIRLENLYSRDQLTLLYNRRGFYNRIEKLFTAAVTARHEFAFISLDMNWLKQINDTYGHAEGDRSLAMLAQFMLSACGDKEICARFGGDEFAIALESENAGRRAADIIRKIDSEIDKYNAKHLHNYNISVSRGYYAAIPGKQHRLERFISKADTEMYEFKRNFKATHTWGQN